jgi:hypothetical protein
MSIPGFAWALEQGAVLDLLPADRLVLIYLADKANGIGVCWPGQDAICRYTGLALRTVRTSIHRLAELGPITLEQAPGVATRYLINRPATPANGTGVNGGNPGKSAQGDPGKPAQGTPANGTGVPRQNSTPHPGKSCIEPRQMARPTPANGCPEPLREPLREPKRRARGAPSEGSKSQSTQPAHVQPAPTTTPSHLVPNAPYASPDEARATFAAYLAAKRREAHGEPEEPVLEARAPARAVKRAAAATIYHLRKFAPAVGAKPERSRSEQIDAALDERVLDGEILPPIRRGPLDPVRTVAEQLAALGCSP